MILGFDIRQHFGRKLALTVKRAAGSKSQENKCQCRYNPENDKALNQPLD